MNERAVVIKTAGDPRIAGAIVDGMTRRVIPMDDGELAKLKAECARLKLKSGLRAYGDDKRHKAACRMLARKYRVKPVGRVRGAILGVWALLWYGVDMGRRRLAAWNRS